MTCKEINLMIVSFFNDELDRKELSSFVHHIENCEECFEELSIQYLVKEGMQFIEDGNTLDLNKEINNKMEKAKRRLRQQTIIDLSVKTLQLILIICLVVFLVWVVF